MTASDITAMLKERHPLPEWAFLAELRGGTGFSLPGSEQFIDAWAINCYASKQWRRVAYEVKVSRSDFQREIKEPLKRRHALSLSNLFYFVAPGGVIPADKVPMECGLLEVKEFKVGKRRLVETVSAPWRDVGPPAWIFVAALARRLLKGTE